MHGYVLCAKDLVTVGINCASSSFSYCLYATFFALLSTQTSRRLVGRRAPCGAMKMPCTYATYLHVFLATTLPTNNSDSPLRGAWTTGVTALLGYVVEHVAGQPLDVFLKQRLFCPLGMAHTGFAIEYAERCQHFVQSRYLCVSTFIQQISVCQHFVYGGIFPCRHFLFGIECVGTVYTTNIYVVFGKWVCLHCIHGRISCVWALYIRDLVYLTRTRCAHLSMRLCVCIAGKQTCPHTSSRWWRWTSRKTWMTRHRTPKLWTTGDTVGRSERYLTVWVRRSVRQSLYMKVLHGPAPDRITETWSILRLFEVGFNPQW